jgi:uncharacterized protein YqeY
MKLQERIKQDLTAAIKAKDEEKKAALRVILGEFARLDKKELSDDEVIKILKKLNKSEREVLATKGDPQESEFIKTLDSYLPQMATDAEIKDWIEQNIDLGELKNKMQAMGPIMKHFGATADGNAVKKVLQAM